MEDLGSGSYLAMHDLEIRGAGEVLGESQSGNMMEVGFQLYNDMLAEAVRSLKAGHEPDLLSPPAGGDAFADIHAWLNQQETSARALEQVVALRHKGAMRPEAATLAEILKAEGYNTTSVGFEGNPAARGFDTYLKFPGWGSAW